MPNLFSKFPKINYTFRYLDKNNKPVEKTKEITNIHIKFKFSESTLAKSGVAYPYQLRDQDRPDALAEKYYGTSDFYWLVMYSDKRYDVFNELPKSEKIFFDFLKKKYENSARVFYNLTSFVAISPESIQTYIKTVYNADIITFWVLEQSLKNIDQNPNINIEIVENIRVILEDIIQNSIQIIAEYRLPNSSEPSTLSTEMIEWYNKAIEFIDDIKTFQTLSIRKNSFPSAFRINNNENFITAEKEYFDFEMNFYKKYAVSDLKIIQYTGSQVHSFYDKEGFEIDPYAYFDSKLKFSNRIKTIYEYEEELNQLSRTSFLVDSRYSKQIKDEFEDALNQVRKDFEQ